MTTIISKGTKKGPTGKEDERYKTGLGRKKKEESPVSRRGIICVWFKEVKGDNRIERRVIEWSGLSR